MKYLKILSFILIIISLLFSSININSKTQPKEALKQAIKLSNEKKYKEALVLLEKIKNEKSIKKDVYFTKGIILQKQKKWLDAVNAFKETIKINKKHIYAHYHSAMIYEKLMKKTMAIKAWNNVLKYAKDKNMKKTAKKHIEVLKK